jgi:uncharacterized protein YlxW (UPF0749 family)
MSTNDAVRKAQNAKSFVRPETSLTASLADSTGVSEQDVAKVLNELGFSKNYAQAVQINDGQEPHVSTMRVGFRIGRSLVVM